MSQKGLAVVSVPIQEIGALYDDAKALCQGTVFENLYMPFFAAENLDGKKEKDTSLKSGEQKAREELLSKLLQVSFVMDDLALYLDTHEKDGKAMELYEKKAKERALLKQEFAETFYPLTRDCIHYAKETGQWNWQEGPMPWEGACV